MELTRLAIRERSKGHPIQIASPEDFKTEPFGSVRSSELIADPRYSLYCFDFPRDVALFVKVEEPEQLDAAAFYYQAQFSQAVEVVEMSLATFHELAVTVPLPPKGLIFIHSTGRCGSTLISKVFGAVPGVQSLSEPDELTQIILLLGRGTIDDTQAKSAMASSVRWRCKARAGQPAEKIAIKTRSEVLFRGDLLCPLFPDHTHLFLYRNAISWMSSVFGFWPHDRDVYDVEQNREMQTNWRTFVPIIPVLEPGDMPLNPVQIRSMAWILGMESYLKLREWGVDPRAIRYEDICEHPREILAKMLEFCGLDSVDWDAIQPVLDKDSQRGTMYDREERRKDPRRLTPELIADLERMVASRPLLRTPDVVLPATLD